MWRGIIGNRIEKRIRTRSIDFFLGQVRGTNILLTSSYISRLILFLRRSPRSSWTKAISLPPPGLLIINIRRSLHMKRERYEKRKRGEQVHRRDRAGQAHRRTRQENKDAQLATKQAPRGLNEITRKASCPARRGKAHNL